MGQQREEIETSLEKAKITFVQKLLQDPTALTPEEYEVARTNIAEIITIATHDLRVHEEDLAVKLTTLRDHAAHAHVDITLPEDIKETAAYINHLSATGEAPQPIIRESHNAGLLRTLARGHENA